VLESTLTFCTIQIAQQVEHAGFLRFAAESVKRYGAAGRFLGWFGNEQIVHVCSTKSPLFMGSFGIWASKN